MMDQQTIPTSASPEVIIEQIDGNFQLKGWDRPEVSVKANPDDLNLHEQDDVVHLSCRGNCTVRLPEAATVKIGSIHGDAHIKLLEDLLTIDEVHGSLMLRNVGDTSIETIHGNLLAKQILGSLRIESLSGNANVRDVQGQCLLEEVEGNLDLRDVEGNIHTSLDGNARLRLELISGDSYQIEARGNVDCRLPEDAHLDVRLSSEGETIKVKLPNETKNIQGPECQLKVGDGGVPFSISAGGVIFLSAQESGPEEREEDYGDEMGFDAGFNLNIARQIESQIEAQMENLNRQMSEQMANLNNLMGKSGLSPQETEQIMQRARESGERAAARTQEKMRRAQEKLERKLEAARRRTEMKAQAADRRSQARPGRRSWGADWPSPPPPPPAKEPVSDEERLMILRMLEQKKITIDEAEQLLAALEGKE